MSILERSDVHQALEEFLAHGVFGINEKGHVIVKFPIHQLDAFVAALGFEARIAIREITVQRNTTVDEWRGRLPGEPEEDGE